MTVRSAARAWASLAVLALAAGCASQQIRPTAGAEGTDALECASHEPFSPYTGPKAKVAVVQLSVKPEVAKLYPDLVSKKVGFGLSNRVLEAVYDTGRFEFVEEKTEILNRMAESWSLGQAGVSDAKTGQLQAPDYLLYAEIYEYASGRAGSVAGASQAEKETVRIGIQARLVDAKNGSVIPGSAIAECSGEFKGGLGDVAPEQFDVTALGRASDVAVREALGKLVERGDRARKAQ